MKIILTTIRTIRDEDLDEYLEALYRIQFLQSEGLTRINAEYLKKYGRQSFTSEDNELVTNATSTIELIKD